MKTESLSLHEARARALAPQGFDRKRLKVDAKALARVVAATQLADWLGLARIAVGLRGNFAKRLARVVANR